MLNFQAIKIYSRNYAVGIHGNDQESSDCFEYPKKFLLKSNYPKKYLPKFSSPKKSWNRKLQTKIILRSSLSLEIWGTLGWLQRRWSVLKLGGFTFHSAICIPLLRFCKVPFALFVGTSSVFVIDSWQCISRQLFRWVCFIVLLR